MISVEIPKNKLYTILDSLEIDEDFQEFLDLHNVHPNTVWKFFGEEVVNNINYLVEMRFIFNERALEPILYVKKNDDLIEVDRLPFEKNNIFGEYEFRDGYRKIISLLAK